MRKRLELPFARWQAGSAQCLPFLTFCMTKQEYETTAFSDSLGRTPAKAAACVHAQLRAFQLTAHFLACTTSMYAACLLLLCQRLLCCHDLPYACPAKWLPGKATAHLDVACRREVTMQRRIRSVSRKICTWRRRLLQCRLCQLLHPRLAC